MRNSQNVNTSKLWKKKLTAEEIESIEEGLKDLEEGRIYSHKTAKKVYKKYL